MNRLQRNLTIVVIVLVAGYFIGRSVLYTVNERELAVILQFGEPVAARTEPGLYVKTPLVQRVSRLPKTKQFWSAGPQERLVDLPTADGKKIEVTPWAVWRITDPQQFVEVLRTTENAQARVQTIVRSSVRDVITQYPLAEAVRSTDRELTYSFQLQDLAPAADGAGLGDEQGAQPALRAGAPGAREQIAVGREKIVGQIKDLVRRRLEQQDGGQAGRGIELVDVGISRIDFVPQVREAAFDRLIAFMDSIASRYTNEGVRRKQEILNLTNAEVQQIEGEGSREANRVRGEVDAEVIEMYAKAIRHTGEFYNFVRTLEAYKEALAGDTRLILTTESEFLKLIKELDMPTRSAAESVAADGNATP